MDIYYKNLLAFPEQLGFAHLTFTRFEGIKSGNFDAIVIAGMGDSGLPGEILQGVREEIGVRVPIILVKDYEIPPIAHKNQLCVFISFSGGTEEVISAFNLVGKRRARVVIAGGGKLRELADKEGVPVVSFDPDKFVPRQATGLMFYALLAALQKYVPDIHAPALSKAVDVAESKAMGNALAKSLKDKTVLVYASGANRYLAYNWKIRFNENAKTPSFVGVLPEINHNEIAGFHKKNLAKQFFAIFLNDPDGKNERIAKRIRLTQKLLGRYGVESKRIDLAGASMLEKTWNSILYAEWTSYYLARYAHVDPFDTKLIEAFKKMMKE